MSPGRHDSRGWAGRLIVVVFAMTALVAMHLWIGRGATMPGRSPGDQWGYLGNARYLADSGPTWMLPNFPYFTYGYSAALMPAFRLFDDPEQLFFAIRVTNALLVASVFPLLIVFCRRVLGFARRPAMAGGFVGALVPGAIAHSSAALAENLVLPLVVIAALACWAVLTDRPAWQRLAFGPSMIALVVTHNRFVLALAVTAVVLIVGVVGGLIPRWIAAANGVVSGGLLAGSSVLRGRLVEARWVDGIETPAGPASDSFEVLTSWSNLGGYLLGLVGQIWYVAAGTVGLGLTGIVSLSRQIVATSGKGLRGRLAVVGTDARRLTIMFLLLSAISVLLISSYFFFRVENGSEGFIAGRHNDSFVPVWTAAGVAFLLGERIRRRVLNTAMLSAVVVVVLAAVLVLVRDRGDWKSLYSILNVPAVVFYARTHIGVVLIGTAAAVGLLLMIAAIVAARGRPGLLVPIACAWMVATVASTIETDQYFESWDVPERFAQLDVRRAAVVQARNSGMPPYYQYFLPELDAVPWDGRGKPPETFVFAPIPGVDLERFGARLILIDDGVQQAFEPPYTMGLWVMRGSEFDQYRLNGQLLPTPSP